MSCGGFDERFFFRVCVRIWRLSLMEEAMTEVARKFLKLNVSVRRLQTWGFIPDRSGPLCILLIPAMNMCLIPLASAMLEKQPTDPYYINRFRAMFDKTGTWHVIFRTGIIRERIRGIPGAAERRRRFSREVERRCTFISGRPLNSPALREQTKAHALAEFFHFDAEFEGEKCPWATSCIT